MLHFCKNSLLLQPQMFNGNLIKKFTASVLLLLFTILLTEKAMHSHDSLHNDISNHQTVIQNDAGCKICDFQVVPDADFISPVDYAPVNSFYDVHPSPIIEGYTVPFSLSDAERGPPGIS
jgi:hypothetical protein